MLYEGAGFVIRPYKRGDEPALARHANNRAIWRNLRDRFPFPYTIDDARRWVAFNVASELPHLSFAIAVGDEVVGAVGVQLNDDVYTRTGEIGYWLSQAYWGQGIATEAVKFIAGYGFLTLDMARLEASVFGWNPASARVLEKNEFVCEARLKSRIFKDGEFTDELIYARLR